LTVANAIGCVATVTHGPYIILSPELFVPNVFSPNGDGNNDRFMIDYTGSQTFNMRVTDRWGVQLYTSTNKNEGWDGMNLSGQASPEGVYFYEVIVGGKEFVGNVSLFR
jgi:gliding motility-associated-like protein